MRDYHEALSFLPGTEERLSQVVGVEGSEALVEKHELAALQERTGKIQSTALAVREAPARIPNDLVHPARHLVEKLAEPELTAEALGLTPILGRRRPTTAHEEIEREHFGENVVLVELWRGRDPVVENQR